MNKKGNSPTSQTLQEFTPKAPNRPKATDKHRNFKNWLLTEKGYQFRYDIVRNRIMWRKGHRSYKQLNESELWEIVQSEYAPFPMTTLLHTVTSPRIAAPFNPLKKWLEGLKCEDGVDYIRELCQYIVLSNPLNDEKERLYMAFKKWFVGAIKTLYDPLYVHKQALIFQGASGIGKTPFIQSLLPKELFEFMKYAPSLDLESKDAKIALTTSFIINFDEIDDFFKTKKNRDNYKSYMTQKYVNVRLPYGKTEVSRQRITSFMGTCNESAFLNDPTGTQRFTVFSIEKFINKRYGTDKFVEDFPIWRTWAYAFQLYIKGFDPEYTHEELVANEEANEIYKYNSAEYDTIVEWLAPAKKGEGGAVEFMTATDICAYLNGKQDVVRFFNGSLGKILIRLKFKKNKKKVNGQSIYGYSVRKLHPDIEVDTSVITKESLNKFMANGH